MLEKPIIVLLSGPVAVGKTTVADALIVAEQYKRLRSGAFLSQRAKEQELPVTRTGLQELGDRLDLETDYRWLIEQVAVPAIEQSPGERRWLVDAVRKLRQVEHFRSRFGSAVLHLHLTAPEKVLQERYERRQREGNDYTGGIPYAAAVQHPNETAARSLQRVADLLIDVTIQSTDAIVDAVQRRVHPASDS